MLTYNFTRDVCSEELSLMGHLESSQQESIEARISHVWQFTVLDIGPEILSPAHWKQICQGFVFFFPFGFDACLF